MELELDLYRYYVKILNRNNIKLQACYTRKKEIARTDRELADEYYKDIIKPMERDIHLLKIKIDFLKSRIGGLNNE